MNIVDDFIKQVPKGAKLNYDQIMRNVLAEWEQKNTKPKLLIHSCCAPCSTYVLELLTPLCEVTIFYSNSNIHPRSEYERRSLIQKDFISKFNLEYKTNVIFIEDEYNPKEYHQQIFSKKLETEPEGGKRCNVCFELRLDKVAQKAFKEGYDYFASAMSVSPYKNSEMINTIGFDLQLVYNTAYLPSDFKKKGGYQRSITMSKEYDLYRQCYCGCIYSAQEHKIDLIEVNKEATSWLKEYYDTYPKENQANE